MVVEASLANCYDLGMARATDQLIDGDVELLVGMVGMRAERAIDLRKSLGNGEHIVMPFDPGRDGDHGFNAGRLRTCDHGLDIAGKIRKIEVTVAVDQCQSG